MTDKEFPETIITVTINGQTHKRNLSEDLQVDEAHINDYLCRAPALTAYWNSLYEQQRSITQRLKVQVDRTRASLDKQIRKELSQDGSKATNAEIESTILCHEDYQEIEDSYLDNRENELLLKGAVEAIRELRSTLISLSANMRSLGDIKINARDKEEALRERMRKNRK